MIYIIVGTGRIINKITILAGLLSITGFGITVWAVTTHLKMAAALQQGRCDGCVPWHPVIIIPLILGLLMVLSAGIIIHRHFVDGHNSQS